MTESKRQIFEVEITHRIRVTAFDEGSACRWVRSNVTEWSGDCPEAILVRPLSKLDIVPDDRNSLPWSADGAADDEVDLTVLEWVERREAK